MKKKLKFLVVFNCNAGSGRKIKLINNVIELIKKNHEVELFKTQSEKEAKTVFKKISKINFDRLVVAGGDGTMFFALNEMINNNIDDKLIGYIPLGTANILKIETHITNNTQDIYQVLTSNKYKKINLSKINGKYFFLMTGVGFDSKIIESISKKLKKYLGKFIFIYKGIQHFLFLKNNKMEIELDGDKIMADWILCTNSKYYAGRNSITNDTNIFENKIIVYIFKDLTRMKLIYYFWLILTKGDLSFAKNIIKKDLNSLKISGINNKLLSHADGENLGYQDKLLISKTKKFINLLVP